MKKLIDKPIAPGNKQLDSMNDMLQVNSAVNQMIENAMNELKEGEEDTVECFICGDTIKLKKQDDEIKFFCITGECIGKSEDY